MQYGRIQLEQVKTFTISVLSSLIQMSLLKTLEQDWLSEISYIYYVFLRKKTAPLVCKYRKGL